MNSLPEERINVAIGNPLTVEVRKREDIRNWQTNYFMTLEVDKGKVFTGCDGSMPKQDRQANIHTKKKPN